CELRTFVDLSCEKAFTERAEGNETDSEFLKRRQHVILRLPPPNRVFALNCRQRLNGMSPTDCLCSSFGKAKMFHLTLLDQLLHRPSHIVDWHVRINPMLIKQIDGIDFETLERRVSYLLDMFRPAIQAWRSLHPSRNPSINPCFCMERSVGT